MCTHTSSSGCCCVISPPCKQVDFVHLLTIATTTTHATVLDQCFHGIHLIRHHLFVVFVQHHVYFVAGVHNASSWGAAKRGMSLLHCNCTVKYRLALPILANVTTMCCCRDVFLSTCLDNALFWSSNLEKGGRGVH